MAQDITVSVSIQALLEVLKENREQHKADYVDAVSGYRQALREELQDKLFQLDGQDWNTPELPHIKARRPDHHLDAYDEVIDMLEFAQSPGDGIRSTSIELTQSQYRQFVKDDWDWKQFWSAANSSYVRSVRS